MFISLNIETRYVSRIEGYKNEYLLLDDDFTVDCSRDYLGYSGWFFILIREYSKRDLPVAKNIVKALLYYSNRWNRNIDDLLSDCITAYPEYKHYEQDIYKYLLLI